MIKTSVGMELAGPDLRLAVVRSAFNKLRLLRRASIEGFLSMSEEDRRRAVQELLRKNPLPSSRIHLTLPHEAGIIRQMEFPSEVQDKLKSVLALQMESLSPWPGDAIYWDFIVRHPGKGDKTIWVTIVIIPRAVLDPWIEFFRSVKLPLSGASLSAASWAHGSTSLWTDGRATIILGCEAGTVEGALVSRGRLVSITVPGEDVESQARAAIQHLFSLSRLESLENARIIAHGSSAEVLAGDNPVLPLEKVTAESTRQFGAVAAAMSGIRSGAFCANLVPLNRRFRRNQLQLVPTYVLFGLVILMGGALLLREPYQSTSYVSKLDAAIQEISPAVRNLNKQESELNLLSEKYRALIANLSDRDDNLEALRDLVLVLPQPTWLSSYQFRPGTITISGLSQSASELQRVLEESAMFKDVQFTTAVTRDESGKDRFTIRAAIEGKQ